MSNLNDSCGPAIDKWAHMADPQMLSGQTILVVEAEFLIALDIQRMLEGLGAGQMLFARTAEEAHQLQSHWPTVGLAIVEVQPEQPQTIALLQSLRHHDVTIVLSSADSAMRRGHPEFPDIPMLVKPMADDDLANAIRQALSNQR
jgi:CheY-like chemotaxis protein